MRTLILISLLGLNACTTTGQLVSKEQNGWMVVQEGPFSIFVWCSVKNDVPTCTEPELARSKRSLERLSEAYNMRMR